MLIHYWDTSCLQTHKTTHTPLDSEEQGGLALVCSAQKIHWWWWFTVLYCKVLKTETALTDVEYTHWVAGGACLCVREREPADTVVRRRKRKVKQGQRERQATRANVTHICTALHSTTPYITYYSLFSCILDPVMRPIKMNDYFSVDSHSPPWFLPLFPTVPNLTHK